MLSLLFKEILTYEQDLTISEEFKNFPKKYESDAQNCKEKVSVFVNNENIALEKVEKLVQAGMIFVPEYHDGTPFFHERFLTRTRKEVDKEQNSNLVSAAVQCSPVEIQEVEIKPCPSLNSISPPPPAIPQFGLADVAEIIKTTTQDQYDGLKKVLENQFASHIAAMSTVSPTASNASGQQAAITPIRPSSSSVPPKSVPGFAAKNELIANGIKCEKCSTVVKVVEEPISKLMDAVRTHVMEHFDSDCPRLKRFECRSCPDFKTNFVNEFEDHLKRHGSMIPLPERRKKLTVNLLTDTHLKVIAQLCSACFPGIFEKTPPSINSIEPVNTPLKAKMCVFPSLDRTYCRKYNIPFACAGRASLPASIRID